MGRSTGARRQCAGRDHGGVRPGRSASRRLGRTRPLPGRSPRLHRAAWCRRGQGDRADAGLHRPSARAMKLLAVVVALLVAPALTAGAAPAGRSDAPVGRSDAPAGQITWAVHTTLVPTYFDPAETTIITSFMVLYALHARL